VDVVGGTELLDQLTGGIVIAVNDIDGNAGILQAGHLLVEKQSRFKALESGVVEITGDNQKIDFLSNGGIQYFLECAPRCVSYLVNRSTRILGEALQRGVEVDICTVDEFHVAGFPLRELI
jgi:hypothetical protein